MIGGWGQATASRATLLTPSSADEWTRLFDQAGPRGVIGHGGGSYAAAAQNAGGLVVSALGETAAPSTHGRQARPPDLMLR